MAAGCGAAGHYAQSTGAMIPTIGIGDHLATFEIKNENLNPIERFDIVVYKPQPTKGMPVEKDSRFIHRVIGLPNEKIETKKGKIFINGIVLNETFATVSESGDFPETLIPEDEYFLLGDNRSQRLDSRYRNKPTIKREDIFGKVTTIISKEDWDKGKRW